MGHEHHRSARCLVCDRVRERDCPVLADGVACGTTVRDFTICNDVEVFGYLGHD